MNKRQENKNRNTAPARGIALILVMLALSVAMVLALTFMAETSTSTAIAVNIRNQPKARQIAETGLALALFEIINNADWRTDHKVGGWVNNAKYGGGKFDIDVLDGEDLDGDGFIDATEGDGDLADDASDPATVIAIGVYEGVSHRVRAVVRPPDSASGVVVAGHLEVSNYGVIDSYDSSLGPYGGANVGSDVEALAESVSIIEFGQLKGTAETIVGGPPLPPIPPTPDLGPSPPDRIYNSGVTMINSDHHSGYLEITCGKKVGCATLIVDGDVDMVVDNDFAMNGESKLLLTPGSQLDLFVGGNFKFNGEAFVGSTDGSVPKLNIYCTGTGPDLEIKLNGNATSGLSANLYVPNVLCVMTGSLSFSGQFFGRDLQVTGSALFHVDVGGAGGGGGDGKYKVRWIE